MLIVVLNGCETWPLRLTRTLLTWRIWRAPNNASKWQMGFNSEFKWLRKAHKAEKVQEQGTEENEEEVNGCMRKLLNEELHNL